MEEQGGEIRESKYRRLQYGGDGSLIQSSNPNRAGMEEQGGESIESKYRWLRYGSITEEPPEGFSFMYHKIQTETGEKCLPITMDGIPILQVKPGYRNNNKPQPSEIPLDLMKYMFPDYDPSDPYRHISSRCPDIPKPCVLLNAAHKKRVLDAQAAAIQRQADLKHCQEEALEAFNRNYAANSSAPTASTSGKCRQIQHVIKSQDRRYQS